MPGISNVRAVVFDLDGVLMNSAPCHRSAFESIFERFAIRDFVYAQYAGWRTADVIRHVLGDRVDAAEIARLASEKSRLARQELQRTNPVHPEAMQVLAALAPRYRLGLASSGSRESIELFLDANGCSRFFQAVLTGGDVRSAKPAPEIYERIFAALGVEPVAAAVVEDAVSGVESARAAHTRTIFGYPGTYSARELQAAGATHLLARLSDLPGMLANLEVNTSALS
jgi:HAD superfamily hydrolase (TIGR01509 family)